MTTGNVVKKLCDGAEMVNGFCYLGDRLKVVVLCETAVTERELDG